MKVFFISIALCLVVAACCSARKAASAAKVKQGIGGYVRESAGNRMPSPDVPVSVGRPVQTTVYIYEATDITQVDRIGETPFYRTVRSRLVAQVDSDSAGYFAAELPEGSYSLFVKVGENYYANSFDTRNRITPVLVEKARLSLFDITISSKASY